MNIEPNKTTILFHHKQQIYDLVESKLIDDIYPIDIPNDTVTPTIIPTTTTSVDQENDWSFNMEDFAEFDELASDTSDAGEDTIMHVRPPADDDQVTNRTPPPTSILTSHLTPVAPVQTSAPSVNTNKRNTSATPQHCVPKKRTIHAVEEDDDDEGEGSFAHLSISSTPPAATATTPPKTQQRIHVPRVALPNTTTATPTTTGLKSATPNTPRALFAQKEHQRFNTLNKVMTVDCSLEEIKANYPRRKEILTETYRISIDEYLLTKENNHPSSSLSIHPFPKGSGHDHIALYTRGTSSNTLGRHRTYQLGAVNLKSISMEATVQKLTKELKLVCKKPLQRPVQIQMDHADLLCPVLISLKSKEHVVHDDLHGQGNITYSEITDEDVINNGFKVRWRKDLYSGNLVVQFTSIYSLGSGYGPSDFRELLTLMLKQQNTTMRPKKVMAHIQSLAHQLHQGDSSNNHDINYLEQALNTLTWKKQDTWDLGYGSDNTKALACLLLPLANDDD